MVTMPDFGFDREGFEVRREHVYEYQAFVCTFVLQLFLFVFVYVAQTSRTTDSTRAVQGACYYHLATTQACRPPAEKEGTPRVVP